MGGYEKNGIRLDGYFYANFALITVFYFLLTLDMLPYFSNLIGKKTAELLENIILIYL